MKLATMRDGSRDGQLVVVSRDLTQAHYASGIANHLRQVLEDWNFLAPQLQDLYGELNAGRARHAFALDTAQCLAPLPRSQGWISACPYPSHRERCAQGDEPIWRQDVGGALLPPSTPWSCEVQGEQETEVDFSVGLAALTGDIPRACPPEQAGEGVRLLGLALTLARAQDGEMLASTLAPVAVTPDELGEAWRGARAYLTLQVQLNGRKFGLCDAGADMAQDLGACIARAARARGLMAGSIVAALPASSADPERGFCSLRERRCVEAARDGAPNTPWLGPGDALHVQARWPASGEPLFGAIELQLT